MNKDSNLLKTGGYAAKQIFANCSILRFSHQTRFKKGIEFVKHFQPKSILDYGCGDATFLYFLKDLVVHKFGLEVDTTQLELLKSRFKGEPHFNFYHIQDSITEKFDLVTCFEVLEHCTDENIEKILEKLASLANPNGHILISVPKETGLTMIGKQIVRRILGWQKFGSYEYTETYSWREFFIMLFATESSMIKRKFHEVNFQGQTYKTCGHKGFNWKQLKKKIENRFIIDRVEFTPKLLPFGLISSQVWFVCRVR